MGSFATFWLAGQCSLLLALLLALPACAQTRCAGDTCAERGAETDALHPIRSQRYRIALRVGPIEARELTSANYRLRTVVGSVQLEARP
jgi:hypothetical protein